MVCYQFKERQGETITLSDPLPVFVVYDSVDERIVDGGGFGYDCRDGFGVRRQDVGMSG